MDILFQTIIWIVPISIVSYILVFKNYFDDEKYFLKTGNKDNTQITDIKNMLNNLNKVIFIQIFIFGINKFFNDNNIILSLSLLIDVISIFILYHIIAKLYDSFVLYYLPSYSMKIDMNIVEDIISSKEAQNLRKELSKKVKFLNKIYKTIKFFRIVAIVIIFLVIYYNSKIFF